MQRWEKTGLFFNVNKQYATVHRRNELQIGPAAENIDYVWANAAALSLVDNFTALEGQFATHDTMSMKLAMSPYGEKLQNRIKPRPFAIAGIMGQTGPLDGARLAQIKQIKEARWQEAVGKAARATTENWEEADKLAIVDEMMDIMYERAERILAAKSGEEWRPNRRQRGKPQPIRTAYGTRQVTKATREVVEVELRQMIMIQIHRAQERLRVLRRLPFGNKKVRSWNSLKHYIWFWGTKLIFMLFSRQVCL